MSRLFGPIRQLGFVVRDIELAMRYWAETCGIGPWFYTERFVFNSFSYAGQRHDDLNISVAMANSGDMQIELVQQRCQTPSMYREFLETSGEGLQHWAAWRDDYDDAYAKALASGYVVGQEGELPRGRFVYFKSRGHPGTVFEFNEITPIRRRIIQQIRDAAATWDGQDPIRRS
jgi:hypothetical protein